MTHRPEAAYPGVIPYQVDQHNEDQDQVNSD